MQDHPTPSQARTGDVPEGRQAPDTHHAARPDEKLEVRRVPEDLLDEAVEATFPASDPVAVVSTKAVPTEGGKGPTS